MVSSLAVVLGLMLLVAWVARRTLAARPFARTTAPLIQVLATGYLGPRKSVSLVSVAGELLIIGTTTNDLVPLGRINDPERVLRSLPAGTEVEAAVKVEMKNLERGIRQ
jgi:flagellar protein FliO/FliZ